MAICAIPALADAPDPVPSATHGTIVRNADGSHTLTVSGGTNASTDPGWMWTTHKSDCNTNRAGVGVAIAWNDPTDPGNPISGTSNGNPVTIGLGTKTDNVVHPTPGPVFHDIATPADFASWRGGCGVFNGTYNTGLWGPFSHTYPASVSGPFTICPLMYDVHGKTSGTEPNGVKEVTAGGAGHNGDNSLESNQNTPLGNGCFSTTFKDVPPAPPAAVTPPPAAVTPPPAQVVAGVRVTPGSARLAGPTGCTSRAFNARVRGTKMATVTFRLDGKVIKKVSNVGSKTLIKARINPASLRLGVHRLVVTVTFQQGTGTKTKTMRLSFQRCAKKLAPPRFTG
jgi:hypothetical protein